MWKCHTSIRTVLESRRRIYYAVRLLSSPHCAVSRHENMLSGSRIGLSRCGLWPFARLSNKKHMHPTDGDARRRCIASGNEIHRSNS